MTMIAPESSIYAGSGAKVLTTFFCFDNKLTTRNRCSPVLERHLMCGILFDFGADALSMVSVQGRLFIFLFLGNFRILKIFRI